MHNILFTHYREVIVTCWWTRVSASTASLATWPGRVWGRPLVTPGPQWSLCMLSSPTVTLITVAALISSPGSGPTQPRPRWPGQVTSSWRPAGSLVRRSHPSHVTGAHGTTVSSQPMSRVWRRDTSSVWVTGTWKSFTFRVWYYF